ncbi:MAG: hypothetical protein Q4D42_00345 [Eubacteriales bacterium]|nr:hypothetical protein [Eubacteriales bacterium]
MKRLTGKLMVLSWMILCVCLYAGNALAAETVQEIIQYEDGTYAEITLTENDTLTRSNTKSGTKTFTYKNNSGQILFTYTLTGYFQYGGSTSKAVSCSTKYNVVRGNWSKKSDKYYCSGNTAYGNATFSNSSTSKTAKLTITCSKTGTIS